MKTLLASAMLLIAVPMAAQAPGKADPHASHAAPAAQPAPSGPQVPKWMQSLDMTPAQRQEIARIHHDAHARMDAAKKQWASKGKSPDNDAAAKAEMQTLMDAEHAAFRAALSPAVQPAYDAALKAHMGAEHGTAAGQPAGMKHDGMKHDGMKAGADKPRCCNKGESKPPTGTR
ncbi:MAG: hypothetical protein ACK53A_09795 [Gemmatimonadota bacterium]|nr:hypothetical protein [Gemmatimonadota bacterium]